MIPANYQDLKKEDIPTVTENGMTVRIIAGESYGHSSSGNALVD